VSTLAGDDWQQPLHSRPPKSVGLFQTDPGHSPATGWTTAAAVSGRSTASPACDRFTFVSGHPDIREGGPPSSDRFGTTW